MAVLALHNVSTKITDADRIYIRKILEEAGYKPDELKSEGFDEQIATIQAIQFSAFHTAPDKGVLPPGTPREPLDLYNSQSAYCGDRSRYMYKALRHLGFPARYVSIYAKYPDQSFVETILSAGINGSQSHAIVEVQTEKGWLVIDSRTHWISLTHDQRPVRLYELQKMAEDGSFPEWSPKNKEAIYFMMEKPFYVIYGLYSRHGRFYPPYTPYVPDIDWKEFVLNLAGAP